MGRSSLRHPDGLGQCFRRCLLDLDPQVEPPTFKIRGSMLTDMTSKDPWGPLVELKRY